MGKFKIIETFIKDLIIIEPTVFGDNRGFFMESYNKKEFSEIGINCEFVQDNHSKSKKGVLRGLHFQNKFSQAKLVRVIRGKVWDVAIDLRIDSKTFGMWFGVELSEENKKMLYVPEGFGHGFVVISEEAEYLYKTSDYYHPEDESGIIWNDKEINIDWKLDDNKILFPILSEKDKKLMSFMQFKNERGNK